ncbi:MAG: heterodisulfide reductase-related iron-sulfur binding cluster, partial [Mariprofundaceae bacterium]|nr:heterodisulfide reductase-related iron-sulfur binding cluster [Mariprofundaceae bacterium]
MLLIEGCAQTALARADAVVMTAGACSLALSEYPRLLRAEPELAAAQALAGKVCDISELMDADLLHDRLNIKPNDGGPGSAAAELIAFHPPCTQQHGLQIRGRVEAVLSQAGYRLASFDEALLCCGVVGAHVFFEPDTARPLGERKLDHIT